MALSVAQEAAVQSKLQDVHLPLARQLRASQSRLLSERNGRSTQGLQPSWAALRLLL